MKLVIVNCGDPEEYAVVQYQPLAPSYIAAYTPARWSVEVVDENFERFDPPGCRADLVALSAIPRHVHRAYQHARVLAGRGITTVGGGLHVSAMPEEASQELECIVRGEAEPVWQTLLEDFEAGRLQRQYVSNLVNGQIVRRTPFTQLFVPPAPADDGTAVGAALLAYREHHGAPPPVTTPYLGSCMRRQTLERLQRLGGLPMQQLAPQQVPRVAARLLSRGKIVGWVQGRAEFGPRALGNRSILADPRQLEVRDRLNSTVKYREAFRPFAPSILHEQGPGYFEHYQASPHMERVLRFKSEVTEKVPGVVHTDGTGRLQSVERSLNPRYYDLIAEFQRLTNIPLVLNTSFNVMGKPIIHTVEDAISVFFTSGMDALVIEDLLLEKGDYPGQG